MDKASGDKLGVALSCALVGGWGPPTGGLLGPKELISRLASDYECLVWFPDMLSSEEVMR